jgi:hypothetical protein
LLWDSRIDSVGDDFYNCQNAIDVVLGRTAGERFLGGDWIAVGADP